MDKVGNAVLMHARDINKDKKGWSKEKTRHMCILSGCDYMPSLKGIGIVKAEKAIALYGTGLNVKSCVICY